MRTVTYGAACSLDGFIAAADGGIDWLHFSKDVQKVMASYWTTIDAILMGRATWEVSVRKAPSKASAAGGIQTYVFSRSLPNIDHQGVHLVRDNAGEFVRALKQQPGKGICVLGGGALGTSLLEAGVVDEITINVHPVVLGSGVPLFRETTRRVPLALVEARPIDGGCVLASYRVRH